VRAVQVQRELRRFAGTQGAVLFFDPELGCAGFSVFGSGADKSDAV